MPSRPKKGPAARAGSSKRAVLPKTVWDSRRYKFTHGILAGDILSISGQNGINLKGEIEGKGDFDRQTRISLRNMGEILAQAKMSFTDVVMLRSYFIDIGNLTRFTEIMAEFFGDYYPAASAIEVRKLALPELLIEVDAVAVRQASAR